jgi:general secretion pathway protein K
MRQTSLRLSERGLALLATLLTVALLTVIVVEMTDATLVNTHLSRNAGNAIAAQLLARSALLGGEALLMQDAQDKDGSTRTCKTEGLWALPISGYPAGSGTVDLKITDEEGKIDLNGAGDPRTATALRTLFQDLGLDPKLVDEIAAWISPAGQPASGPEASTLCQLTVPCTPRHAPLASLDELRLLRGFDDLTIRKLTPYVTAYGEKSRGLQVNANTADPLVLKALGCEVRGDSAAGAVCATKAAEFPGCEKASGTIKFKSSTFAIIAAATVGDTTQTVRSIVRRGAHSAKRYTWSERPISDLSPAEVR